MIGVQVYGSASNLASLERYGLKILEDARMDYKKAFSDLEIFLGEVFHEAAKEPKPWQIFDLYIDECRRTAGEKAVGNHLEKGFIPKLGYYIQYKYLPPESPRWLEMEGNIGIKVSFTDSYCPEREQFYNPAKELSAKLFEYAIKGYKEMFVKLDNQRSYKPKILRVPPKRIRFNPHFWRRWFYSLWGQPYEWGSFRWGEKKAEANERVYFFDNAPKNLNNSFMFNPRPILEAHGFTVKVLDDGMVEYYR